MGLGGSIVIHEEEGFTKTLNRTAVIRLSDIGTGIPESIKNKL